MRGESQNEIEPRIKETPTLQAQYVYSGIETQATQLNNYVDNKQNKKDGGDKFIPKSEIYFNNSSPIGNSVPNNSNAPSWFMRVLTNEFLDTSVPYLTASSQRPFIKIPQLETSIDYTIRGGDLNDTPSGPTITDIFGSDADIHGFESIEYSDGKYTEVVPNHILLEVQELNVGCASKNFDIEIFEIIDEKDKDNNDIEILKPLYFALDSVVSEDSEEIQNEQALLENYPDLNDSHVEYFMDINVDNNIEDGIFCRARPIDQTKCIYAIRNIECPDLQVNVKSSMYVTDIDPPDIC